VAALLGALGVYLWLTGLQMHHSYATACHPASSLACAMNFTGRYGITAIIVSIFLQAVPALIGAFAGAPVLARELETGTFRYAWTQGIGRWRWTLGKLVPLAIAVAAAAGAFSVLFSWYNQPFFAAGYAIPFSTRVFDLHGVAFAAWTLAAFAIGALAGMLIRRVVPAIAATLAVYAGLAFAAALYLREHYMTPLVTSSLNLPGSAWIVSQWYTKSGKFAFPARGSQIVNAVSQLCPGTPNSPAQCLSRYGYTQWTSYQPGSRFWPFQWIEAGWLVALSVLLIAATVWLVRRRAA
jgi:ABC-2 family transporter protein